MFFRESDILLKELPEYTEAIKAIDSFISSLEIGEQQQLDPKVVAQILAHPAGVVEHVFAAYSEKGLLVEKQFLWCPKQEGILEEIGSPIRGTVMEFCDLCGVEHEFTPENVVMRYKVVSFLKLPRKKERAKTRTTPAQASVLTNTDLQQISNSMPLLNYYASKIDSCPFEGKRFLVVLHFLKDLIPFLQQCEKLGLNPSESVLFYKEYLYPHKDTIVSYLKESRYVASSLSLLTQVLADFEEKCKREENPIIIIEDGGYVVPAIHNSFPELCKQVIGAVEQTTRGIRNDEKVQNLRFPIMSVAGSESKKSYEPPNVAAAIIHSLQKLLRLNFRGQSGLLIGYGSIGQEIARQMRDTLHMRVTVFDLDPDKLLAASQEGFGTERFLTNGVKDQFLIIGASGETSIRRNELLAMKNGCYLVSASSDQREIDLPELEALSSSKEAIYEDQIKVGTKYIMRHTNNAINLVADGFPVNFWAEESMPNQVSDLVMTLILLSAVDIAVNHKRLRSTINADRVNGIAKEWDVTGLYLSLYHA